MMDANDQSRNVTPSDDAGPSNARASLQHDSARHPSGRPSFMTVGSGSLSESAAQLQAILDDDSGYGGSIIDGSAASSAWFSGGNEDRPLGLLGEDGSTTNNERRPLTSHIMQSFYNRNMGALRRAIQDTVKTLEQFQAENQKWPAHYPSVAPEHPQAPVKTAGHGSRPSLQHTMSTLDRGTSDVSSPSRPGAPRRSETSIGENKTREESGAHTAEKPKAEPRLLTPGLVRDFSVLKVELKMAGRNQTDLVHSLEKGSIASLLDNQIQQSKRHLLSLRDRIEDTSSKVLVTGDLNAGKSTFCNALLRRKVLPEDQQPCTAIFCEVLDARANGNLEEVHAIRHDSIYDRNDESTYQVFDLRDLEKVVVDNDSYEACKVYIRDNRSPEESLLNNGVVDIALIDAPGLNHDTLKTTALYARQEEIDVVIFVVSATNHFTESARNFVFNASREKAYIFTVVNGFDVVRDKERCQEQIMKQVKKLSPATFKDHSELVHFVNSTAIPVGPGGAAGNEVTASGGASGGASSSGSEAPGNDPHDDDDEDSDGKHGEPGSPGKGKGKGKDKAQQADFAHMEVALRRFVLEKRARSKLAPAKTYLVNLLVDLHNLGSFNRDIADSELTRVKKELEELVPAYEQSKKARTEAGDELERNIEETTKETYDYTRDTLTDSIDRVSERDLGIQYPGLLGAFQYAEDIRDAMISEIAETVRVCEDHARNRAIQGFNGIKQLGFLHLGDSYTDITFLSEKMYKKSRHALARQVDIDVEFVDFFDVTSLWERQEKLAGTSMAVTVAGVVGTRALGGFGWVDGALGAAKVMGSQNLRRLIIPGIIAAAAIAVSYAVSSIPRSLPRRISSKLSSQLLALDYVHSNASRISAEVRRALKGPAHELRIELQRGVEKLETRKNETAKLKSEAFGAQKYFGSLVRRSQELRDDVDRVDLEGQPTGAAQYA